MTPDKARAILKDAITTFTIPENKGARKTARPPRADRADISPLSAAALAAAIAQAEAHNPPEQRPMIKMQLLVPLVTGMAGPKLQEHGLPNVMMGVMQLQAVGQQDPVVGEGVQILTAATMGNPPADEVIAAYLAKLG